ncbi:DsrE family protein [Thioalkalicoccus limnaeus]|uniref:DsrE family protein n=1 Tax=Thioalkalicoccus limnaeus TaxID=120681 RepID=A0ABV4BBZ7_9GAMM
MKAAIVVMSDPQTNSDEALGRVFNALGVAYDFKQNGDEVTVIFLGAGTRWAGQVTKADHPLHGIYKAVEDKVAGVSATCSDFFGAAADAEQAGFAMLTDNAAPGTSGLPSLRALASQGYQVMIF